MASALNEILSYRKDPNEDFYGILGCDRTSTEEQISAEYKARARELHPDKCGGEGDEEGAKDNFQRLQTAKDILTDAQERRNYDKWLDSSLSISFRQWRGLKDSAQTSMHWATPRTLGRMLGVDPRGDEPLSLRTSPVVDEEDETAAEAAASSTAEAAAAAESAVDSAADGVDIDDVYYPPTPYAELGFRVATPPPELGWGKPPEERKRMADEAAGVTATDAAATEPTSATAQGLKAAGTSQRRKQFAQARQDSSIGTVMIMEPIADEEMRRRFRNYEI